MTRDVRVIGVGNTLMGDDGVGSVVARAVADRVPDDVTVIVGETAGMQLAPHFMEADAVIVVDAIDARDEPGAVFRFDPDDVEATRMRSNTSHGIGLPYLVTSARMAGHYPEVVVFAVQVGDVRPQADTLSPAVAAAVPEVVRLVAEEAGHLRTG